MTVVQQATEAANINTNRRYAVAWRNQSERLRSRRQAASRCISTRLKNKGGAGKNRAISQSPGARNWKRSHQCDPDRQETWQFWAAAAITEKTTAWAGNNKIHVLYENSTSCYGAFLCDRAAGTRKRKADTGIIADNVKPELISKQFSFARRSRAGQKGEYLHRSRPITRIRGIQHGWKSTLFLEGASAVQTVA